MIVEAFICTYNEADILPWVLKHLREQGVRTRVIDNWSADGTFDLASELADAVERFPSEPTETYDWTNLLMRVETLAMASEADWCMHHDADEIRRSSVPGESLQDGLARIGSGPATAMNFRVVNFKPIDDGWDGQCSPEEYFRYYEARGHYDGLLHVNAWKNSSPLDIHSRGGHEAWFPGLIIAPERFITKHYAIRSQRHGERKVLRDRIPRWNSEERFSKGWHCHYNGIEAGHNFLSKPEDLELWTD